MAQTFDDLLKAKDDDAIAKAATAAAVTAKTAELASATQADAHADTDVSSADTAISAALVPGERYSIADGKVTIWAHSDTAPGYTTQTPTPSTDPV